MAKNETSDDRRPRLFVWSSGLMLLMIAFTLLISVYATEDCRAADSYDTTQVKAFLKHAVDSVRTSLKPMSDSLNSIGSRVTAGNHHSIEEVRIPIWSVSAALVLFALTWSFSRVWPLVRVQRSKPETIAETGAGPSTSNAEGLLSGLVRDMAWLRAQTERSLEDLRRLDAIEKQLSGIDNNILLDIQRLMHELSAKSAAMGRTAPVGPTTAQAPTLESLTNVYNQALVDGSDVRAALRRSMPEVRGVTLVSDRGLEQRIMTGANYNPRLQYDDDREPFYLVPGVGADRRGVLFPRSRLEPAYIKYLKTCFKTDRESGSDGSIRVASVIRPATCECIDGEWRLNMPGSVNIAV